MARYQACFILLLTFRYLVLGFQKPPVVRIGGLYAIRSTYEHPHYIASKVSLELINKDPNILTGTQLDVSYLDVTALRTMQNNSEVPDMQGLMLEVSSFILDRLLHEDNASAPTIAFVGPYRSSDCILMQPILHAYNRFALSYAASSPRLSNKRDYPNIGRVSFPDTIQGPNLAELILYFGWKHVQTITCSDAFCQGLQEVFLKTLAQDKYKGITVDISANSWEFGNPDGTKNAFMSIRNNCSAPRVLLLLLQADQARALFTIAKTAEVFDEFVWVGCDAVSSSLSSLPSGYIGLNIAIDTTSKMFLQLKNYWKSLDPVKYPGFELLEYDPFLSMSHDALFAYALALDELLSRDGDPRNMSDLIRSLHSVNFIGSSGQVRFDGNLESRDGR